MRRTPCPLSAQQIVSLDTCLESVLRPQILVSDTGSAERIWLSVDSVEEDRGVGVASAPQGRLTVPTPGLADEFGDLILDELVSGGGHCPLDLAEQASRI